MLDFGTLVVSWEVVYMAANTNRHKRNYTRGCLYLGLLYWP